MGWPRRIGVISKKEVVDPRAVDLARVSLAELGVALGAGFPALAARLLADLFRDRDWDKQPLSELLPELDRSTQLASAPQKLPWQALVPIRLAQEPDLSKSEYMPWGLVADPKLLVDIHWTCASALLWGLLHPNEAKQAYEGHAAELQGRVPMFREAGLGIDAGYSTPTLSEWLQTNKEIELTYEQECRSLGSLPIAFAQTAPIAQRLKTTF